MLRLQEWTPYRMAQRLRPPSESLQALTYGTALVPLDHSPGPPVHRCDGVRHGP